MVRFRGAAALSAVGVMVACIAQAQEVKVSGPTAKNIPQICINGTLDSGRLSDWYFYTSADVSKNFKSPEDLRRALQNPDAERGTRRQVLTEMAAHVAAFSDENWLHPNVPGPDVPAERFLAGQATGVIIACGAPGSGAASGTAAQQGPNAPGSAAAAVTPSNNFAWLDNFRVRGTSDDLVVPRNSTAYAAASAATLSFTDTGTTHTLTNALQAAIGYDFSFAPKFDDPHWPPTHADPAHPLLSSLQMVDLIPFIAVDRNITAVSGKQSASSRENVMLGLNTALTQSFFLREQPAANVFSTTGEHIWNNIDNSQINFLHFVDLPVVNGYLNDYAFVPCCDVPVNDTWFAVRPILDLRGDLGYYSNLGRPSSHNHDYSQVGTQFGLSFHFEQFASDLTITQIMMHEFETLRNDINFFRAVWNYNLFGKDVGLQASYQNGNLETTGQRTQQWLISLSAKH